MRQVFGSQFGFDGYCQGIDAFPRRLFKFPIHKFDIEISLNLKNELENVNGVDLQTTNKQRFIIL